MTLRPEDLTDEALVSVLALARLRRETDGRLGIREELARLEREAERRAAARAEVAQLSQMWEAS